jgi:hypothetical protein
MYIHDSCYALRHDLEAGGDAIHRLDPWHAWRAFKRFLHAEMSDCYDAAALQFVPAEEADPPTLLLVRQYTARSDADGTDELLGRVVLELRYPSAPFSVFAPTEVWTLDFRTLEEWASVVEGQPCFQEAMARTPLDTDVYFDQGIEGYDGDEEDVDEPSSRS